MSPLRPEADLANLHVHGAADEFTRRLLAIFLAGWVVGFIAATVLAGMDDDFGGVYNPVRYYKQLVQLQASPWSLLSPDLSAKLRDSRREILGGTAAAVVTLGAYAYGGAPLALKAAAGAHHMFLTPRGEQQCMSSEPMGGRRMRRPKALPYLATQAPVRHHYQLAVAPPEPLEVD